MDYFTQVAMVHGNIYESLAAFKIMEETAQAFWPEYVEKSREFFNVLLVPHFEYEEQFIFPVMLRDGTTEEKEITRQLIDEHNEILTLIDQYRVFLKDEAVTPPVGTHELPLRQEIYRLILDHTRKEDLLFYPNIKKYLLQK